MKSDDVISAPHDPSEVVPHPSGQGWTIKCRNCGRTSDGMQADRPDLYDDTIWFCALPGTDCQDAVARRVVVLHKAHGRPHS